MEVTVDSRVSIHYSHFNISSLVTQNEKKSGGVQLRTSGIIGEEDAQRDILKYTRKE